jgi:electron transfer flavoprotein alpha subunit
MSGKIYVLAEHQKGKVSDITYEMLGLGREIADKMGATLTAVLLGHNSRPLASTLGIANSVIYIDDPALVEMTPESYVQALVPLIKESNPDVFMVGCTNLSIGIGTLLSADLNLPFVNYCKKIQVEGQTVVASCILYGGKIEAEVTPSGGKAMYGISPGACSSEKGRSTATPQITDRTAAIQPLKVVFRRFIEPQAADIDITKQDVLVAVGRGIQTKDNITLAEDLSKEMGGAVCASRPVIDQGWLPMTRQVGRSGMIVKPKLFIAAGISGAPEHVEGMKGSQLIISINTDPNAPIFDFSHYGIVGDVLEILPLLTDAIRTKKGG